MPRSASMRLVVTHLKNRIAVGLDAGTALRPGWLMRRRSARRCQGDAPRRPYIAGGAQVRVNHARFHAV
jgi:hypothetical protein